MVRRTALILLVAAAVVSGGPSAPRAAGLPDDSRTIAHVLNRVAFGPRPGEIERVQKAGLQKYIDDQLHPERIADQDLDA
jgi:hypothetical protein